MQTQFHTDLLRICSLAHKLQGLQYVCMRESTQNMHMGTHMESPRWMTLTHTYTNTLQISVDSPHAHYQSGSLSVAVSRKHTLTHSNQLPHSLSEQREKRGNGPQIGFLSTTRAAEEDQSLTAQSLRSWEIFLGCYKAFVWWTESPHGWVKKGGRWIKLSSSPHL